MKGDFTRDSFGPKKNFSAVLMQQGRVTLDADFNEQSAIERHHLRTALRDVIGPFAAPAGADGGFGLALDANNSLTIDKGRFYVDGILVENEIENCTYKTQPDFQVPADDPLLQAMSGQGNTDASLSFWAYLDAWERHISSLEDDSISEKALGGPDTCTRAKVTWQIRALPLTRDMIKALAAAEKKYTDRIDALWAEKAQLEKKFQDATDSATQVSLLKQLQPVDEALTQLTRLSLLPVHQTLLSQLVRISNASMAARVNPGIKVEDACITPPASRYRGTENQFYRVEIHRGGAVGEATFKWSRDNGSVATTWLGAAGSDLQVARTNGFSAGNWVELSDDSTDLLGQPGPLVQLVKVEGSTLSVDPATTLPPFGNYPANPKVRRWDHIATDAISLGADNAIPIQESPTGATGSQIVWLDLEDGVQIQFSAGGNYRSGDYWWFPARVATGNIEWPQDDDLNPQPLPPQGVLHHYATLGLVTRAKGKWNVESLRCEFLPIFFCPSQPAAATGTRVVAGPILEVQPQGPRTTLRTAASAEKKPAPVKKAAKKKSG